MTREIVKNKTTDRFMWIVRERKTYLMLGTFEADTLEEAREKFHNGPYPDSAFVEPWYKDGKTHSGR